MSATVIQRLRRDQKGASVIEFGLFLPILSLMLVGVTDLSMGYAAKLRIEGAVFRALEKIQVGSAQSDYDGLRDEVAAAAGVSRNNVAVDQWLECDRARQTSFTGSCSAGQVTSRYVKVTVNTVYTPRFGYGPLVRNSSGVVPIMADATLRVQ